PVGEDGTAWEENRRRAQRVARALAGLRPEQREAIVLHDIEGFSVEEVAEMQRVTLSAVKSRLTRGREKLRRFYLRLGLKNETAPRSLAPWRRNSRVSRGRARSWRRLRPRPEHPGTCFAPPRRSAGEPRYSTRPGSSPAAWRPRATRHRPRSRRTASGCGIR